FLTETSTQAVFFFFLTLPFFHQAPTPRPYHIPPPFRRDLSPTTPTSSPHFAPRSAVYSLSMAPTRVSAHRIGSLLFCPACGTLLDLPKDDQNEIACSQCGRLEPASSYENLPTKTYSS
ncbi:DNA-directed RNA polymerase I subunit RPA12, partial [Cryptococcus neoformans CHC193]